MIDTGTAISGMSVVRSLPRNRNTTSATSTKASTSVLDHLVDGRGDEHRGVEEHVVGEIVGEARRQLVHQSRGRARATSTALAPGDW